MRPGAACRVFAAFVRRCAPRNGSTAMTNKDCERKRRARRVRRFALLGFLVAAICGAGPALAQSCGDDLQKLAQKREASMQAINGVVAAAHGKPLDPAIFCAKTAPLIAVEGAMIAYMEKNKEWCQVPDDAIAQLKAAHVKTIGFSTKACTVAEKIKKMKEQAAQGGGPPQAQPLPAGPL